TTRTRAPAVRRRRAPLPRPRPAPRQGCAPPPNRRRSPNSRPAKTQRRSRGARQRMIFGGAAALALVAGLGVFAFVQWRNADRSIALATNAANAMVSDLAKSM